MLKTISTTQFFSALLVVTCIYYMVVLILYYRKEIRLLWRRQPRMEGASAKSGEGVEPDGKNATAGQQASLILIALLVCQWVRAQTADGNNGISQANTLVRGYFDTGTQLMYAVGAIIGLIGAIRVYKLWTTGHREDIGQAAAGWIGACVFLVIVATVIKSFFGL